jgi:hypothetical protein
MSPGFTFSGNRWEFLVLTLPAIGIRSHLRVSDASKLIHSLGALNPQPYCRYIASAPLCIVLWQSRSVCVVRHVFGWQVVKRTKSGNFNPCHPRISSFSRQGNASYLYCEACKSKYKVLRRNSWEGAIHAALLKTTNSVLVAAIR